MPETITAIRHVSSSFNARNLNEIPAYIEFKNFYLEEVRDLDLNKVIKGLFPSPRLKELAIRAAAYLDPKQNDYNTDVAEGSIDQAVQTGIRLPDYIDLPKAIYVSPYLRTKKTLEGLIEGWPQLGNVRQFEDERLREQDFGTKAIYGDPLLYYVFHPEQALLYKMSTKYEYNHECGESIIDVRMRVRSVLNDIFERHGGSGGVLNNVLDKTVGRLPLAGKLAGSRGKTPEEVMIVTHHIVILALKANLEDWDREKLLDEDIHNSPPNCSVTIYESDKDGGSMKRRTENLVFY